MVCSCSYAHERAEKTKTTWSAMCSPQKTRSNAEILHSSKHTQQRPPPFLCQSFSSESPESMELEQRSKQTIRSLGKQEIQEYPCNFLFTKVKSLPSTYVDNLALATTTAEPELCWAKLTSAVVTKMPEPIFRIPKCTYLVMSLF